MPNWLLLCVMLPPYIFEYQLLHALLLPIMCCSCVHVLAVEGKILFYYTHDKENPNYIPFSALESRYEEYGWTGSLRGDIPHLFRKFEGRDKKQWGKTIFGEAYANWPVPMKGSGDDEGAPHGGPCAVSAPRLELLFNHTIH
jgi:hypothetical protein